MRRFAVLAAAALVVTTLAAGTVAAGGDQLLKAPSSPNRVIVNAEMAPWGTTVIMGRAKADIHQPTSWTDPPGSFSFDAVNGTKFRTIIERVFFWPWWDDQGNEANWAFVWGHECPFHVDGPPTCTDVAWAFVDYHETALTDFQITCWFDDGARPQGVTWEEICDAPTANQDWSQVVNGSIVVLMSE